MKKLFIPLMASLAMVSCSTDETTDLTEGTNHALRFSAVTSKTMTRAVTGVADLQRDGFTIAAYGNNNMYFLAQKATYNPNGYFELSRPYYWPSYQLTFAGWYPNLDFFGEVLDYEYSYGSTSTNRPRVNYITRPVFTEGTGGVQTAERRYTITYRPEISIPSQKDVVITRSQPTRSAVSPNNPITLNFRHILSQIRVQARKQSGQELNIRIAGIALRYVTGEGMFEFPDVTTDTKVTSDNAEALLEALYEGWARPSTPVNTATDQWAVISGGTTPTHEGINARWTNGSWEESAPSNYLSRYELYCQNENGYIDLANPASEGAQGEVVSLMFAGADAQAREAFTVVPQDLSGHNYTQQSGQNANGAYLAVLIQITDNNNKDAEDNPKQIFPVLDETESNKGAFGWAAVGLDQKWLPGHRYTYTLLFTDTAAGKKDPDPIIDTPDEPGPKPPVDPDPDEVKDKGDDILGVPMRFTVTVDEWISAGEFTPAL